MPPKKKSNKDDNDILTRIAIVNADRSACYGPEALNSSSQTAHLTPWIHVQMQTQEVQAGMQEKLSSREDW